LAEEPSDKRKNELLSAIGEAKDQLKRVCDKSREIVQDSQKLQDVAKLEEDLLQFIPNDSYFPSERWTNQTRQWRQLAYDASKFESELDKSKPLSFATDVRSVSASGMFSTLDFPKLPPEVQGNAWEVKMKFVHFLEQPNMVGDVETELCRLRLDNTLPGHESALTLIRAAEHALKAPSTESPAASQTLITLRAAINRAITDLINRRPFQEKTKNISEKIHSVCKQCGIEDIKEEDITTFTEEADRLNYLLSSSKDAQMSRDIIREHFNQGLVFLRSLLRGIDHNKLRS
jgi:hypothetical protein